MSRFRVLIIGAYGQFGQHIASALAQDPAFELVLAGRNAAAADAFAAALRDGGARASITTARVDVGADSLVGDLERLRPHLVIHTAGPFQQRDYRVAESALACGAHYVDLADGREFVMGIDRLASEAKARQRWVVSGASSVPGLSAAVVDALHGRFARLDAVESAISPGNRTARVVASPRAILGYVGRPFPALINGRWQRVHGWQSLRRLHMAGARDRWVARCDVPDLAVLPARYPTLHRCEFRAGLELRRMHFGLWLASWLVRARVVPGLAAWARPLLRASEAWMDAGSDTGVMTVTLDGLGHDDAPLRLEWRIVAEDGSGPRIPATAAIVLARKLASGALPGGDARPCLDVFSLDEFMCALADYPIRASLEVLPSGGSGQPRPRPEAGIARAGRTSGNDSAP